VSDADGIEALNSHDIVMTSDKESNRNESHSTFFALQKFVFFVHRQGRPLGGANGAIAKGADFEGASKRQSPTSHTLIRNTVAW
jgi:hypothetical protein